MRTVRLGARGPEVSVIGFGAWAVGGLNWGPTDDETSRQAIHAALDAGVTFIDTADVYGYGHSEELVAEVLSERSNGAEVVVATKAGNDFYNADAEDDRGYGRIRSNSDRDYLIEAAEKSLARLRRDCLDILQLHSLPTKLLERDDAWEALQILKDQGKIKHAGWSVTSFKETEQAPLLQRHAGLIDVIQVRYNLLERGAEEELFSVALEEGIGVIVRTPLLFGLLTGKFTQDSQFGEEDHRRFNLDPERLEAYLGGLKAHQWLFDEHPEQTMAQVALRFTLSHPACHTAIPGAKTPQQSLQNTGAADLGPFRSDVRLRLGLG